MCVAGGRTDAPAQNEHRHDGRSGKEGDHAQRLGVQGLLRETIDHPGSSFISHQDTHSWLLSYATVYYHVNYISLTYLRCLNIHDPLTNNSVIDKRCFTTTKHMPSSESIFE